MSRLPPRGVSGSASCRGAHAPDFPPGLPSACAVGLNARRKGVAHLASSSFGSAGPREDPSNGIPQQAVHDNADGEECGCRLIVCNARSRSGRIYPYFICIGRQRDPRSCGRSALRIEAVEKAIARLYKTIRLSSELRLQTEQVILEEITQLREDAGTERETLVRRQRRAVDERAKLLEAHYADAIPLELLKIEQERIARELDYIENRLGAMELKFERIEGNLKAALSFVGNLGMAYETAPSKVRRRINQAMFVQVFVSDDGDVAAQLKPPFELVMHATGLTEAGSPVRQGDLERPRGPRTGPRGLSHDQLVEGGRLELHPRGYPRTPG